MLVGNTMSYQALNSANLINRHSINGATSVARLSSNLRINRASDDPAGVSTAAQLRGRATGSDQIARNAQNAASVAKTADSVFSSALDILYEMRDLVSQSSFAVNSADADDDLDGVNQALQALDNRLVDLGNTQYGGQSLFASFTFDVGLNTGAEQLEMDFSSDAPASTLTALSGTDADLQTIDGAIQTISRAQGKAGGLALAAGYISDTANTESAAMWDAYNSFAEADVARESTNYVKNSILTQQGQLILSQFNQNAYSVLNLLK